MRMKYKVEILPTAWEDLKRIEDWCLIAFDVASALKVCYHIADTQTDYTKLFY